MTSSVASEGGPGGGDVRKRWLVGAGGAVALLVAVVMVRPGIEALPGAMGEATVSPTEQTSAEALSAEALSAVPLMSLPVDGDGIGPLRLGTDVDTVAAAAWPLRQGADGCTRLEPRQAQDATMSGWVVDGAVAAVQVEAATPEGAPVDSGGGFSFGRPVSEVDRPASRSVRVVGDGPGVEVQVASWSTPTGTVTVSDLGELDLRWAEVATDAGARCTLTPELAPESFGPTEWSAVTLLQERVSGMFTDPGTGFPVGRTLEQLGWTEYAVVSGTATGRGCELLELDQPPAAQVEEPGGRSQLWLQGGVVVAALLTRDVLPSYPEVGSGYAPVEPGRYVRVTEVTTEADGATTTALITSELVPELDTAVMAQQPEVASVAVGDPCTPGG